MKSKLFAAAANVASLSTYKRCPVGCVIAYKNKILATGFNQNRTDPLQKKYNVERNIADPFPHKIHAEAAAIKHLRYSNVDWPNVSIYIWRTCKSRPHGMARPCPSCMALIREMGIKNIYYTTDEGFAHEEVKYDT